MGTKNKKIEYIYEIRVCCFVDGSRFNWYLWRRDKNDWYCPWHICKMGNSATPEEAFNDAIHTKNLLETHGV